MNRTDSGSVSILTPLVLCLAVVGGIGLFRFGMTLSHEVVSKDIADAAALACVDFGEKGARQVAKANAAVLVYLKREGLWCHVTVKHQNIFAQSAAIRDNT